MRKIYKVRVVKEYNNNGSVIGSVKVSIASGDGKAWSILNVKPGVGTFPDNMEEFKGMLFNREVKEAIRTRIDNACGGPKIPNVQNVTKISLLVPNDQLAAIEQYLRSKECVILIN
jgi:hypothetical protein